MNYIFDIDGTLADCSNRLHFIRPEPGSWNIITNGVSDFKPDWDAFHKACIDDTPIEINISLLHSLFTDELSNDFYLLTGRPESSRDSTRLWFVDNAGIIMDSNKLLMRKDNDHREDWVIKLECLNRLNLDKNKTIIFDDRDQVVQNLRKEGWTVYQVKNGEY